MQIKSPLIVGITGGIGSGKSIICQIFKSLTVPVYDADSRARWLMENDQTLINNIKNQFGEAIYQNGILQRESLAKLVFPFPEKLAVLNSLTHPAVAEDFQKWVGTHRCAPYVIKEAALFIESGTYKILDELILVTAPVEVRIKRVLERDKHRTEQDIKNIIERQTSDDEKRKFCSFEIVNDGVDPVLDKVLALDENFSMR